MDESVDDDDEEDDVEEGWEGNGNWTGEGEEVEEDVKDENVAYIEFLHEEVTFLSSLLTRISHRCQARETD